METTVAIGAIEYWNQFWAVTTILIALAGAVLCRKRYNKFNQQESSEINERFKRICKSVGLFCGVTILFGLFNFIHVDADLVLYPIRAGIIGYIIIALWKLSAEVKDEI